MAMKSRKQTEITAGGEPGTPGEAPAVTGSGTSKRYSPAKRKALLDEFERSGEQLSSFCARAGVSVATLCTWRKRLRTQGEQGLVSRDPRRNPSGRHGHVRSADARRAAVQAFERSGMTLEVFARTYGCSPWTLRTWLKRYADGGPKALEPRRMGRPPGSGGGIPRVSAQVQAEIVRTKTRFPDFGLKKVRDFLRRFQSVSVSTGTVARTLDRAGVTRAPARKKRGKKRPVVRRFERSRPGELWQSDITSFNLTRHSTKVYLTVFLDDCSRFVVSWNLATHQRQELVNEALMDGVSRFGKPKEVLTDQGRQYFSWRGKSDFQKLLVREGIEHVVSRTHHPETLGKCERLWETVNREFWERVRPQDITDARERLAHWFAHYNFFRPHQGINGLVPADRFFGAQEALRKTHEARVSQRELDEALSDAPRRGVYLFGQIGDEQVSMVGERGELVLQTSSGVRQRIGLNDMGAPSVAQAKDVKETDDADEHDGDGIGDDERAVEAASAANGQEAPEIQPSPAVSSRSPGAVDERHGGGPDERAPRVRADLVDVAGQETARGSGAGSLDPAAARVATQSAGAGWDAGGPPAPTEVTSNEPGDDDATEGRRSARAEEAHRGVGAASGRSPGPDQAALESAETQVERAFGAGVEVTGGGLENQIPSRNSAN
jgi:transposase InsO family protein